MKNLASKIVKLFQVFWFAENNVARGGLKPLFQDENERNNLSVTLSESQEGWFKGQPIKVWELSEGEKKTAVERLQEFWNTLKSLTVETKFVRSGKDAVIAVPSEFLRIFEQNYTKNGKILTPDFGGVCCYRRSVALLGANVLLMKEGRNQILDLPVLIKEYVNTYERDVDCIMENTSKTAGNKSMENHWPSLIRAGIALRDSSLNAGTPATQSDMARVISGGDKKRHGMGQKVYYICTLDARFPNQKIAERILNETLKGSELKRELLLELERDTRPSANGKCNESDVEAFIDDTLEGNVRKSTMAKRKNIEELAKNTASHVIAFVLTKVLEGDLGALRKLETVANQSNALYDAIISAAELPINTDTTKVA